jgi:hypothetical protein
MQKGGVATMGKWIAGAWVAALIFSLFWFLPGESQAQKFPNKSIEFVCHAAAGGGSDIMARMMQSVIEREKRVPVVVAVVNRPGGSKQYVCQDHEGDGNYQIKVEGKAEKEPPLFEGGARARDSTVGLPS